MNYFVIPGGRMHLSPRAREREEALSKFDKCLDAGTASILGPGIIKCSFAGKCRDMIPLHENGNGINGTDGNGLCGLSPARAMTMGMDKNGGKGGLR